MSNSHRNVFFSLLQNFVSAESRDGNYGEVGRPLHPELFSYKTRKISLKVEYFDVGKWKRKSDSVSDTVYIYVKICNNIFQTKDMDSFTMDKNQVGL